MANGEGAGAHLDSPLWKASSGMMRGDRGHEGVRLGMRSEEERLQTFTNWPRDAPVSPAELARAGFHYLGYGDTVQCFCCDGVLRHWVHGDTPWGEHERHFPTCGLMTGRDVGNVPLGSSDSVDGQLLSQLQRLTVDEQVQSGQAVYPEMESEGARLSSYHNWPTGASVQPDALARAGFFFTGCSKPVMLNTKEDILKTSGNQTAYRKIRWGPSTGHGDNVKCFFCDGGLRNWEPGDDPWEEHAKWFPRCEYLLQSRGREYVSNIQQSYFSLNERVGGSLSSTAGNFTSEVLGGQSSVAAAMLSPVVQAVLQMGFQRPLVESLVQSRFLLTGSHYTSVSDLVTDVLQAEEEERQSGEPRTETVESPRTSRTPVSVREKVRSDLSPEEQLRQLQEERTCKVCMDKLVSMVFIPCGHLVVCTDCAASLRHCPICRAVIRGSVRAFMS